MKVYKSLKNIHFWEKQIKIHAVWISAFSQNKEPNEQESITFILKML